MTSDLTPTPEMIAAAWDAWAPRHKPHVRLGPGPAFREAIEAALAAMPADMIRRAQATGIPVERVGEEP